MHKQAGHSHFEGKGALQHVIDARRKGKTATSEIHGTELPGHYAAAADSAKETAFLWMLLWILFSQGHIAAEKLHWLLIVTLFGWLLWKTGRSAILGWARLERLHRLIEEERWEIEHHRLQEKEELRALYEAKGFHGKLLDEVVEHLMADDNRLLQAMLEEELGLDLESHEHPLKQAAGSAGGILLASLFLAIPFFWLPPSWQWSGMAGAAAVVIGVASVGVANRERNHLVSALVWNLAVAALATGVTFLLGHFL